jgi:transcriptional regulator with XRE-family HTH domain
MQTITHKEAIQIGKHLRYLRRVNDHTQEDLAERLGVSVGWVSRIERGVKVPNLPFLLRLGRVLRVPVNELLPAGRRRK